MSTVITRKYDLQDVALLDAGPDMKYAFMVWRPERIFIIIGRSNSPETSLYVDRILTDDIPVLQRPSGGEAVILTPRTLVISAVRREGNQLASLRYFRHYNGLIIAALESLGVEGLGQSGISDIALAGRKILGSSMYRNRERVFYHAVLNVAEECTLMERYLRFPVRQPDYRRNRSHDEFVTSLYQAGYHLGFDRLTAAIKERLVSGAHIPEQTTSRPKPACDPADTVDSSPPR